jgi:hypothetical protein
LAFFENGKQRVKMTVNGKASEMIQKTISTEQNVTDDERV